MSDDNEEFIIKDNRLTLQQVAKACSVHNKTVWRWIQNGELKAGRDIKGHYRIKREELQKFVDNRTQE